MLPVSAAGAAAGQEASIAGVVQDRGGQPLAGVVVTVAHPEKDQVRVVITDLGGRYSVEGLDASAEYRVEFSHPTFRKQETRLQPGRAGLEPIALEPRRRCLPGVR
jgi:hypothetical protein